MAKKRKKTKDVKKTGHFSNRPFVNLKKTVEAVEKASLAIAAPTTEAAAPVPPSDCQNEESYVLSQMMEGAMPIEQKLAQKQHRVADSIHAMDDEELVMRHLDDLVHGKGEFDIADTDEYIEAWISGLDRRIVKKLKKGEFSIQGHLDLHGMNRDEARQEVAQFIEKSFKSGKKCILIVHGRGLGSENHIPVLKEKLRAWLTRGAMGKKVLAYTSARPFDGGTGAVYVLLRS